MKTIKLFNYTVVAKEDLINEILENVNKNEIYYNWFNFDNDDIFYDDNCNEYVVKVEHDKKYIELLNI